MSKTWFFPFVLLVLALCLVGIFFWPILSQPNDQVFVTSGDGLKNYFTFAYYVTQNQSEFNFEGMNFPYGEHIFYTDGHPLLSGFLRLLQVENPVGILNLLLLFSIILSPVVIFSCLKELGLDNLASFVFAFTIFILSPQIFRLSGHLSLSYGLAFPMNVLFILKYLKESKQKYLILIFTTSLIWMLTHAYLGIMILAFNILVFLFNISVYRSLSAKIKWPLLFISLAVIGIYLGILKSTDTHLLRTENPSGFFLYNAEIDDILIPPTGPLKTFLDYLLPGTIKLQWEARGYLGLLNVVLLISTMVLGLLAIWSMNSRDKLKVILPNDRIKILFFSSLTLLLFALYFPFKSFPQLVEVFPVFKQFRATGRFVWPFYFIFGLIGAIFYSSLIKKRFTKKTKTLALLGVLSVGIIEGVPYYKEASKEIGPNPFSEEILNEEYAELVQSTQTDNYQGLITLPFFYQGSETYSRPKTDIAVSEGIKLSYHSGVPLFNSYLTRTSIPESKKIVQMLGPDFYPKEIKDDLNLNQPILILYTGEVLNPYEEEILRRSTVLKKQGKLELRSISPKDFFHNSSNDISLKFKSDTNLVDIAHGFKANENTPLLYFTFDDQEADLSLRGTGAYAGDKKGKNLLAEIHPGQLKSNHDYHISIWMYNGEPDALNLYFRLIIEEQDTETGEWYTTEIYPEMAPILFGDWSLVEGTFRIQNPANKLFIVTKGKENSKASFHADELMIWKSGIDIYKEEDDHLIFNNHQVAPEL